MITAQLHDGTVLQFPDGTDGAVVDRVVKSHLAGAAPAVPSLTGESYDKAMNYGNGSIADSLGGLVRGAGSIGSTIMRALPNVLGGDNAQQNQERRTAIDYGLRELGANPDSRNYKGGKLVGEIAGTAGVGRLLAPAARFLGASMPLTSAIESAGMVARPAGFVGPSAGPVADMAARVAGSAITGGAMTGMVDPKDTASGAVIGGLLPPAVKLAGFIGKKIGNAAWDALTPDIQTKAVQLAQATGRTVDEIIAGLRQQGPSQVPGYQATVPQILLDPNVSQVARTLKSSGQYGLGAREAENSAAQVAAIEGIAPTAGTINDARANVGNAAAFFAKQGEKAASAKVRALFNAVPEDQAKVVLPFDKMQASIDEFLGKASFGKGEGPANTAMAKAKLIGQERTPIPMEYSSSDMARGGGQQAYTTTDVPVPFSELQKLRSSIGQAATNAKRAGDGQDLQAAAALSKMKAEIDNKVADAANGSLLPGEIFTPQAIDAWGQALTAHRAKKLQFNTGPQSQIFRTGADGLPAKEGAEVAPLFWNGGNSQIENMQAFKRLTDNDKTLIRLMKSNATTEALATGAKGPNDALTFAAFDRWMNSHSGAAKELFTPQELGILKAIQDQTQTAAKANYLGASQNSHTAQLLNSMGALDSPALGLFAAKVPFGKVALDALKTANTKSRNETLSALLSDPATMANALEAAGIRGEAKNKLAALLQANPDIAQMMYRAAPVSVGR